MGCKLTIGIKGDGKIHPTQKDVATSPQIPGKCTKQDINTEKDKQYGPKGINQYCEKRWKAKPVVWR